MIGGGEEFYPSLDPETGQQIIYEKEDCLSPLDKVLTQKKCKPLEKIIDMLELQINYLNAIEKVSLLLSRLCECKESFA